MPPKKTILRRLSWFMHIGVKKAAVMINRLTQHCIRARTWLLQFVQSIIYSRDAILGLMLILMLGSAKLLFERTSLGRDFESLCYAQLQRWLVNPGRQEGPPVTIIDLSGIQKWGNARFSEGDFQEEPSALVEKLTNHSDSLSQFVWNQFSLDAQERLANVASTPKQIRTILASGLTKIAEGKSIYSEERFPNDSVHLRRETEILKAGNPQGEELARLNRMLLEDAYSRELRKRHWERGDKITPRDKILDLVQALAEIPSVQVIGVDVDFSPTDSLEGERFAVHPDDNEFFSDVLEVKKKTGKEIYLGVYRQRFSGPKHWLGDEKFFELAAAIATTVEENDSRYYVRAIGGDAEEDPLPGMSFALGFVIKKDGKHGSQKSHFWYDFRQESKNLEAADLCNRHGKLNCALINYSDLPLVLERQFAVEGSADFKIIREKLQNTSAILIGSAHPCEDNDRFEIGLLHRKNIAGIFVLACGAITQSGSPLYELTLFGRVVFDILLALALVFMMVCLRAISKTWSENAAESEETIQSLVFWSAVGLAVLAFVVCRLASVIWTDIFVLVIALFAHIILHSPLGSFIRAVKRRLPRKR